MRLKDVQSQRAPHFQIASNRETCVGHLNTKLRVPVGQRVVGVADRTVARLLVWRMRFCLRFGRYLRET